MKRALIIFIRKPELGKVKTRLAAQIGNENALNIYRKLLHHTMLVAGAADCDKYVFTTGIIEGEPWDHFQNYIQTGEDLGERMFNAFDFVFKKKYHKVIIIGSDCPGLTAAHIEEAFLKLEHKDVIIGPAIDGGFYLLGMKKMCSELFKNKEWSTSVVFENTLISIKKANLTFGQLEKLTDVDEVNDVPEKWLP